MEERPNILLIVTDQERYPVSYETEETKKFLLNLPGHKALRDSGVEFHNHYTASCACTPSRACLYTGHFPSLHGVSQTYGGAKDADDPALVWLQPNTIPTMGNYFQAAGYDTKYIGKWHISHEDLVNEKGTTIKTVRGGRKVIPSAKEKYLQANPLEKFGFSGWIGCEPHGADRSNSGWNRDEDFVDQLVEFLSEREKSDNKKPFLLVINLVNPHDIVFFPFWASFGFPMDDKTIPFVPSPPTLKEDLSTKPTAQASYKVQYSKLFAPDVFQNNYRRFYYFLHKVVDQHIQRIVNALGKSKFSSNTFSILTADHGDLLGAHGLRQKWYNAYQESLHVPLIISHPKIQSKGAVNALTSSVDLIPTMLALAGISPSELYPILSKTHSEVHPLVGTDISHFVETHLHGLGKEESDEKLQSLMEKPVFATIADHVTQGGNPVLAAATNTPILKRFHHFEFDPVDGPISIEVVLKYINVAPAGSPEKKLKLFKYARYWDNPDLWTHPRIKNEIVLRETSNRGKVVVRTEPFLDEFEFYDLSEDPLEKKNLAHPKNQPLTPELQRCKEIMERELERQKQLKNLRPNNPIQRTHNHKIPKHQVQDKSIAVMASALISMVKLAARL